jgi:RimJ/RimL family protein N-acetyltransferase
MISGAERYDAGMTPRLLRTTDADLHAYTALRREMLTDSPWAFLSSPTDDRLSAEFLRTELATPCNSLIVIDDPDATSERRLLASAGVIREKREKRSHLASIYGVYVTPRARGSGLGRGVVARAVEEARSWTPRVAAVELAVSAKSGAARMLYESLGFTAWGIEPVATKVGGDMFDEIHMSLRCG